MKQVAAYIKRPWFLFYFISFFFVGYSSYLLLNQPKDQLIFSVLPLALFVIFLAVFSLEKLALFTVFCTPLAITLKEMGFYYSSLDLSLPTEPLMAGIMLLFILHQLHQGIISYKLLTHPITLCILFQLFWTFITCFTSEMPVISIKFLIARLWFVCTAYFVCSYLFSKQKNMFRFLWLYIIPLILVILYTLQGQARHGFDEKSADWIMSPFYNDHTAYAAAIAMFIPVLIGFLLQKHYALYIKIIIVGILVLYLTATIFSYTRAAWLSLAGAMAVFSLLLLRIKFRYLLIGITLTVSVFAIFQTQIVLSLQRNNTDSDGNLSDNLQSISNIKTDPSNVERLNRWDCALKMFKERPFTGWGPGTYMFQYAPFQSPELKTVISTNAGTNGNSHSEYLGPLSEQGLFGLLSFLAVLLSVYFTAFKLCYSLKDRKLKILVYSVLLGLTTYFVHGFLNNFLDTDKAAIPFWGFIAIILSVDIYHLREANISETSAPV